MKTLALTLPVIEKKSSQTNTALIGGVSLTFMIIAGSVYPVFGKQLTSAFSPLSLLFIGEMMGGLFILMSFGLIPLIKKMLRIPRKKLLLLMLISFTSGVVAPYLWFKGLHLTTAVNAGLFSRTEMIFLIIFSVFILNEKITKYQFAALSVIVFGILFVALRGFSVGITMETGDIFIIVSGLAYSFGGVFVKRDMHDVAPEVIIFVRALLATSFFLAVSPFVHSTLVSEFRAMPSELMIVLLCYGFIAKFLGIYSFHEAIETLKVSTVSMFSTLAIVGSIAFASLYLGEEIHLYQLIGAGLIVLGVLMMQKVGMHKNDKVHEHHMKQHHMHSL
jgi:drug/metabolite transporter (DMT)-like permease